MATQLTYMTPQSEVIILWLKLGTDLTRTNEILSDT